MTRIRKDHTEWTDRLSDYIDGGLDAETASEVEAHLAECGGCRRVLEELREVVAGAAELGPMEPPRDLWGGIAATIKAPVAAPDGGAKVIAFPSDGVGSVRAGEPGERPDRVAVSRPQLAAAAVVLIVASSAATWLAGPGIGGRAGQPDAGQESPALVAFASDLPAPEPTLAEDLATLEQALADARDVLDPNTVRILERNLGVIEQAIQDSRLALAQDPDNAFLSQHLERVYQRKRAFLQEAVQAVEWAG